MTVREFNFDGLVGPSHHYGGLAHGNLAAASNQGRVANPKAAALQGIAKMRRVMQSGAAQAWLPPPLRPDWHFLHDVGFRGNRAQVLARAYQEAPELLQAAWSAARMWTANAATVSASVDSEDQRLHLSVANLASQMHRALEPRHTTHHLRGIFTPQETDAVAQRGGVEAPIAVHGPLPSPLPDEGAANHTRLCADHADSGVQLFVFGAAGERFRARQSRMASEAIARRHRLPPQRSVFAQQSVEAIDAGVFHNDVISVGHRHLLLSHENAFADSAALRYALEQSIQACSVPFELQWEVATGADFSLQEAVQTYVFNSQLLDDPRGGIWLLGPDAIHQCKGVVAWLNRLVERGVLRRWETMDLHQSMRNGGGPACLRLRVPMTRDEQSLLRQEFMCSDATLQALESWVENHYRDRLSLRDLTDLEFVDEVESAHAALAEQIKWPEMFDNNEI